MIIRIESKQVLKEKIDLERYQELLNQLQEKFRAEEGNLIYRVFYNKEDRSIIFFEVWKAEQYAKAKYMTESTQNVITQMNYFYESKVYEKVKDVNEQDAENLLRNFRF